MDHDQRRPVHAGHGLRHREGLPGAGHPQQHLRAIAALEPVGDFTDGPRLITGQREIRHEAEAVVC